MKTLNSKWFQDKQQLSVLHLLKQKVVSLNSTDEAVIQYFSGQKDVLPNWCGSFQRMKGDNSELAMDYKKWRSMGH